MAEIKIKVRDVLGNVKSAGDGLSTTLPRGPFGGPPPPGAKSQQEIWYAACDVFNGAVNSAGLGDEEIKIPIPDIPGGLPGTQPQPSPGLNAIDPVLALEQIAKAINKVEEILNAQSLVIATGSVEADMDVSVGSVAGAHAKISFNITPKPYE